MTGERRCRQCGEPLRAWARPDALFCRPACRAAAARRRRHDAEALRAIEAVLAGERERVARRCPVCGHWFAPGHGRRRDAVYDSHACRTAAWRARAAACVTAPRNVSAGNVSVGNGAGCDAFAYASTAAESRRGPRSAAL